MNRELHRLEIEQLYQKYRIMAAAYTTEEQVLSGGARMYKDMDAINKKYGFKSKLSGVDERAVYFCAEFLMKENVCFQNMVLKSKPRKEADKVQSDEYKKQIALEGARLLGDYLKEKSKALFYIIEPHHDDALGSASGICYNDRIRSVLHTMTCSFDERDEVDLGQDGHEKYSSVKRPMNIVEHCKGNFPDLHYDERRGKENLSIEKMILAYEERYEFYGKMKKYIHDIVRTAKAAEGYLALPLGIEHPMHMLVMYAGLQCVKEEEFDRNKIMFYVDHPYDFYFVGTQRITEVKEFIEKNLFEDTDVELIRCDDRDAKQEQMGAIIEDIYTVKHYAEFNGTMERTLCSYFIAETAYNEFLKFFDLNCNEILYLTAQAKPFLKTGGSGEVALTYCKALKSFVNDVRIMMPRYRDGMAKETGRLLRIFKFDYENKAGLYECEIEKREYEGLIYYLIGMKDPNGTDITCWKDDKQGELFALLCDAIMQEGLNEIDYTPSLLHCNDWQMALIPFLRKLKYRSYRPELKILYTIHFFGYKGIFNKNEILSLVGIDKESCQACYTCQNDCMLDKINLLSKEDQGKLVQMPPSLMSCMKAGIEFADAVSTVSKGYAGEIQGYPDFSGVKVFGIRNGIGDLADKLEKIPEFYDVREGDFENRKRHNKTLLQKKLGLEEDLETPILCMVTRLSIEKGMEVVKNIIPYILEMGMQMVIVGNDAANGYCGSTPYADFFGEVEKKNKGKFAYRPFSEELEFATYAGSDILLMPSLSEACGITQMLAMRMGVVPVVSMLDSFKDTVLDYRFRGERKDNHWDKGLGFYAYKDDCWVFLEVLKKAVKTYRESPGEWQYLAEVCCHTDFEWKNGSLAEYVKLYNSLA